MIKRIDWLGISVAWVISLILSTSAPCYSQTQTPSEMSFTGTIGNFQKIHMKLKFEGNQVSGVYSYDDFKADISLSGFTKNGETFALNAFDNQGNLTGIFKGKFVSKTRVEGMWLRPDGLCSISFAADAVENTKLINNPLDEYIKHQGIEASTDTTDHLVRIKFDFDNDGFIDMAVTTTGAWGATSGGGAWEIYLDDNSGKYLYVDTLFFHPYAIHIEALTRGVGKLLVYQRIDANHGNLYEYNATSHGLSRISERTMDIREDTGKDEAEYGKLFGDLYTNKLSEFCTLTDYLQNKNCLWHKGYY